MGFEVDNAETKRIDLSSHENSSFEVTGLVKHYPAGFVIPYHSHKRCHLLYSQQGVMAVEASSGRWIVPPTTAVWLRPGVEHQIVMQSNICVYGILVDEITAARLPLRDGVLQVSPLLRELIAQLATLAPEGAETQRNALLRALFLEELSLQPQLALHLPWPAEARMAEICRRLVITPADDRGIEAWADSLSISAKTFNAISANKPASPSASGNSVCGCCRPFRCCWPATRSSTPPSKAVTRATAPIRWRSKNCLAFRLRALRYSLMA